MIFFFSDFEGGGKNVFQSPNILKPISYIIILYFIIKFNFKLSIGNLNFSEEKYHLTSSSH